MNDSKSRPTRDVSSLSDIQNRFSAAGVSQIKPSKDYVITISDSGLSDGSVTLLASYNETFRRLFKNTMMFGSLSIEPSKLDYSLLINPLSKIIETELNLSLIYWFRKNGKDSEGYLCDEKGGVRYSLSLGEIYHISLKMFDNGYIPQGLSDTKEFLSILKIIRDLRNSASHTGCTNREEFEKLYDAFNSFITIGYFSTMMMLKKGGCKL